MEEKGRPLLRRITVYISQELVPLITLSLSSEGFTIICLIIMVLPHKLPFEKQTFVPDHK